jgi:hypothetical protein
VEESMNCPACGAALEPNANFCGACGRTVTSVRAAPRAYGAVDDRPTRGVLVGVIAAVVLVVLGAAAYEYYRVSERRRLDAMDYETLKAEHEALVAAADPVRRLGASAVPETKPADYAQLLGEAKGALEQYRGTPRRTGSLPSGRTWPAQYAQAEGHLTEALEKYAMVGIYLGERAKIKNPTPRTTADADQNIENIKGMGDAAMEKLDASLGEIRTRYEEGT